MFTNILVLVMLVGFVLPDDIKVKSENNVTGGKSDDAKIDWRIPIQADIGKNMPNRNTKPNRTLELLEQKLDAAQKEYLKVKEATAKKIAEVNREAEEAEKKALEAQRKLKALNEPKQLPQVSFWERLGFVPLLFIPVSMFYGWFARKALRRFGAFYVSDEEQKRNGPREQYSDELFGMTAIWVGFFIASLCFGVYLIALAWIFPKATASWADFILLAMAVIGGIPIFLLERNLPSFEEFAAKLPKPEEPPAKIIVISRLPGQNEDTLRN